MRLAFSIFLFSSFLYSQDCLHDESNFKCVEYVRNYDADTVTFNIPKLHPLIGKHVNVRVAGVDTPEIRTKDQCEKRKAVAAKKLVQNLLKKANRVDLRNISRGKYFRIVADIIIDGVSLQELLLKSGHAYSYTGGTKKKVDWCQSNRAIASKNTF